MALLRNKVIVCTSLECKTVNEMVSSMEKAKIEGADLVELQMDALSFLDISEVANLIKRRTLPVIVSYRLKSLADDTQKRDEKKTCFRVLGLALELDAEFVEVELEVASDFMRREYSSKSSSSKIIVSCYKGGKTPSKEELSHIVVRLQSIGADVIKLVIDVANITDVAPVFHLISHCQVPLIALAMGDEGLISQLLCTKFGGFLVYGSISGKPVSGLPTVVSLRQVYKIENLNMDTKVFGLIAKPVSHSKGPILHNSAFRHAKYNGVYVPMLIDDIKEFFGVYSCPDFAGFSVGIPHKEAAVSCCDEVHPLAQSVGAVNTIIRRRSDGKLVGYNTDSEASITAIEDALKELQVTARKGDDGETPNSSPLAGKVFVLVGAGGAGRALAFGAKSRGARVVIFNRNYERAKALAFSVSGEALPLQKLGSFCPEKGMILANATSIGMQPNSDKTPMPKDALGAYELVFDAVYTPRNTRLLQEAEEVGAIVVSGVEMFVRQAIGQFSLFTGGEAPEDYMRRTILAHF